MWLSTSLAHISLLSRASRSHDASENVPPFTHCPSSERCIVHLHWTLSKNKDRMILLVWCPDHLSHYEIGDWRSLRFLSGLLFVCIICCCNDMEHMLRGLSNTGLEVQWNSFSAAIGMCEKNFPQSWDRILQVPARQCVTLAVGCSARIKVKDETLHQVHTKKPTCKACKKSKERAGRECHPLRERKDSAASSALINWSIISMTWLISES